MIDQTAGDPIGEGTVTAGSLLGAPVLHPVGGETVREVPEVSIPAAVSHLEPLVLHPVLGHREAPAPEQASEVLLP